MIGEVISIWCLLLICLSWCCYWSKCLIVRLWIIWNNWKFHCRLYSCLWKYCLFFIFWIRKCWVNRKNALLCCCWYCFNYFFIYEMWWSLNILLCKISCSILTFLVNKDRIWTIISVSIGELWIIVYRCCINSKWSYSNIISVNGGCLTWDVSWYFIKWWMRPFRVPNIICFVCQYSFIVWILWMKIFSC